MKKKLLSLILTTILTMTVLAGCGSADTETDNHTPSSGNTENGDASAEESNADKVVTIAVSTVWDTLNPLAHTSTNTDEVQEMIYDRLIIVNGDGTYEPRLASSWEANETQDIITIHLNENATWHDGVPVTAEDVVYTFQLTSNQECNWLRKSNTAYYLGTDDDGGELSEDSIEIYALDDHTVELHLKQPVDLMAFFERYIRDVFILPSHLLKDTPDEEIATSDFWDHPIGSGPFVFDSQVDGERIELIANTNYYLGAPKFGRLVFRLMDSATITAGLLNGEVDLSTALLATDIATVEATGNIVVDPLPSFQYQTLVINLEDSLFTKEVRQAIGAAINKQAIVDSIYLGYAEALKAVYPSSHPYYNENLVESTYDPERAKQLLEEAGWDYDTVLELQVSTGNESRLQTALLIQQDLEAVGIKTEIVTYDFATVLQNMRDNKYQLLCMGSAGSIDPTEGTGSLTYFSHTTDEYLLGLIDAGAAGITFEERKPYYDEIQEIIVEDVPVIFMYSLDNILVYNNRLSNVTTENGDFKINKQPWLWEVE